jgi:general secretion pathway protein L
MAACFIAILAATSLWGGGVWMRKQQTQELLDTEISRLSSQVVGIETIEDNVNKLKAQIDYLDSLRQANLKPLNALQELSRIIPTTAWINNFHLSEDELKIDGYAASSSELVPKLDASPLFADVAFLSAITKGRNGKERFRIGLRVTKADDPQR